MHTKIASLWRFIRTPALLTSTTVLLISCASRNPLIDEVEQPRKETPVVSATTDEKTVSPIETDKTEPKKTKPVATSTDTTLASESDNELNRQPEGMKKWISKLTPYKVDIQQGNFVSSEMLSKLKPGMTKEQVRFVLGTPLLTDIFHANRWDYIFRLQKPNGAITTNRVTIFFNENLVERIINDRLPDEAEYLSHIAGDKVPAEKAKKSPSDEYKPSDKKVSDVAEKEAAAQSQENSLSSSAPDEPVSTSTPVGTAEPVTGQKSVKTVEPVRTAEPVSTVEPVKIAEPVKAADPVKAPEPVKTVEPVQADQPVNVVEPVPVETPVPASPSPRVSQPAPVVFPVPAGTSETEDASEPAPVPQSTRSLKRPERMKPARTDSTDDETTSSKDNIKTFEPISIPSRTGKILPGSPNDQLIGNIQ